MRSVLVFATVVSCALSCTPPKPWSAYSEINFADKCGASYPQGVPRFDLPVLCGTDEQISEDIAFSVANGAFQCDRWCLFSLTTDVAWLWNPSRRCWGPNPGCLTFQEEKTLAANVKSSLCSSDPTVQVEPANLTPEPKACTKLRQGSELSLAIVQEKCPEHTENHAPQYQNARECETGQASEELAQALATGAYAGCAHWCVFSLRAPSRRAWLWDNRSQCWKASLACLTHTSELVYAQNLRESLCDAPCSEPYRASALSPKRIKDKCPEYNSKGTSPLYHSAFVCSKHSHDVELAQSLANFAFISCGAWCVFSIQRPNEMAWKWNSKITCWEEDPSCLAIPSEHAFVQTLQQNLCMDLLDKPPQEAPLPAKAQPPAVTEGTTAAGDKKVPGAIHTLESKTIDEQNANANTPATPAPHMVNQDPEVVKLHVAKETQKRDRAEAWAKKVAERRTFEQVRGDSEKEPATKKEDDGSTRKKSFSSQKKSGKSSRKATTEYQDDGQPTPNGHFRSRMIRRKDPLQESYKIFCGLALVCMSIGFLAFLNNQPRLKNS